MALSAFGEAILRVVLEPLFEVVCYFTGKILVLIISLGYWHTVSEEVSSKYQPSKFLGIFNDDGRITVSMEGQSRIGLLFYLFLLVAFLIFAFVRS